LPYARSLAPQGFPALSTWPEKCWRDELTAPLIQHEASGSRRAIRPALSLAPDAAASTATRLAKRDDTRSPLKDEPGWATHTTNPNFGKVEYFCDGGLTGSEVFARRPRPCSPDGAQRNPGFLLQARAAPDYAALHPGYEKLRSAEIPWAERQIQDLPLPVQIGRQHLVGLAGLERGHR